MAKITEHDRAEIIKLYASGRSAREIAKSLHVSHTAISKILNEIKSCQEQGKVDKSLQKVAKQNNHELAKQIIDKAMASVVKDIDKTSPMDRIKIVERLMFLYGNNENQKSALDRVIDAITGVIDEE